MTKGASPRRRRHPRHRSRTRRHSRHRSRPTAHHPAHRASSSPPRVIPPTARHPARSRRIHARSPHCLGGGFRDFERNDSTAERRRSSITTRNACAPTHDSRRSRWRVSMTAAGSVAASKARRCPNQSKRGRKYLSPPPGCTGGAAGVYLGRRSTGPSRALLARLRSRRTRPTNAARTNLDRKPSESGRPGRIQGARAESSQVHARRAAARAPDPRDASTVTSPRPPRHAFVRIDAIR
jgi:hypothetical protein